MKFRKINNIQITNAIAYARRSKAHPDTLYYNIVMGSEGEGFYPYYICLASKYFKPSTLTDTLELSDNNYTIQLIKDKDKQPRLYKDGKKIFSVYKSNGYSYPNDTLLIWEIPNVKYTNVKYTLTGCVEKLEEGGGIGKERNGVKYYSPSVLLEIYGDCKLEWSALNEQGLPIKQTVTYKYDSDEYSITDIEVIQ